MKASMIAMSILASEGWPESGFRIHHKGFSYEFNQGSYVRRRKPVERKPAFKDRNKKGRP